PVSRKQRLGNYLVRARFLGKIAAGVKRQASVQQLGAMSVLIMQATHRTCTMQPYPVNPISQCSHEVGHRRGAFMVLAAFALFVAFSIDTGNIALNKTIMQNAVDAAAMAAAMEITNAVENAPPDVEDPTSFAREQAKTVAANTAAANGVYVDPGLDVEFGLRWY